jgi:hypothetical protein
MPRADDMPRAHYTGLPIEGKTAGAQGTAPHGGRLTRAIVPALRAEGLGQGGAIR